jgi:hypothetical protein
MTEAQKRAQYKYREKTREHYIEYTKEHYKKYREANKEQELNRVRKWTIYYAEARRLRNICV